MADVKYALSILRNGGVFIHKENHITGVDKDGNDIISSGFRTYIFDANRKLCHGPGVAERWILWDAGLLEKNEIFTSESGPYMATYKIKE